MASDGSFYENGVTSVNLPIATQVVGACSSRSTHPRSLQLLSHVVQLMSSHQIDIDNPFIWKTKAEVIGELAATQHAQLITRSLSCTRSRTADKTSKPHCGACVQCLHRRISILAGGAGEIEEREGYQTDFLTGPQDGPDRVMVIESINLALDCANMSEQDFVRRFADPLSRVLSAYPTTDRNSIALKVADLHWRHGEAVRAILIDAIRPQVPGVLDQALPSSSLLALVLASRLSFSSNPKAGLPPPRLPEPTAGHTAPEETESEAPILRGGGS